MMRTTRINIDGWGCEEEEIDADADADADAVDVFLDWPSLGCCDSYTRARFVSP